MQQLVSPYIIQFIAAFRTSREFILGEFSQDNQGVHIWLGVHSARLNTRMGVDKKKRTLVQACTFESIGHYSIFVSSFTVGKKYFPDSSLLTGSFFYGT